MEGKVYIAYTIGMIRGHDKGRRLGGVEGDRPQFRKRGKGRRGSGRGEVLIGLYFSQFLIQPNLHCKSISIFQVRSPHHSDYDVTSLLRCSMVVFWES